ncbi:MAG: bifunctional adenosylcobinamide kinase/adenosylcobinamide-phosphate guanylyltransferase [Clostridia bacterium]|nr:bifunctional adenosylcobinamide kinase/adenosylcobinamide-phosphate guanylyltransferase [Clostridia bacterium]
MIIMLTGGSDCGKSHYAEELCLHFDIPRYYIAAMMPFGDGSEQKIERHRQMRAGKGFETVERYTDLAHLSLPRRGTVLLECVCNLTANEMFDGQGNMRDPYDAVMDGIDALARQSDNLIIVTNDVGSDSGEYTFETRKYIEVLGRINAALAQKADSVLELVCGIPIVMKGERLI